MNSRISHILPGAHPRTADPAVRGRAVRSYTRNEVVWAQPVHEGRVNADTKPVWDAQTASSSVCRPCGLALDEPLLPSLARRWQSFCWGILFLMATCVLSSTGLQAQTFPVNALVQVSNFSPRLEAYDDPGRVVVTLISTDERPEYEALLRISLSGPGFNIRTREDFLPFPILLRRNQPLILTGAQLRDYFDPANLAFQGVSLENYLAGGGLLSEGPVSLCVEVYDYNRFFDPPVSNTGCSAGFMILHRPPILTEPGSEVVASFPQQVRFQWQPQHAGVAARYTLEVYEDILPGMGDNLIIDNTQPLLLKTTLAPFYLMTSLDPLLQVGTRYLVRVRAEDIAGQAAFLNNGWSDIYSFVYLDEEDPTGDCPTPANLMATALDPFTAQVSWQTDPTVASWLLTSNANDSIPLADTAQTYTFTGLTPAELYAYQLCAICTDGSSQCSQTTITLPADTTSGPCGPILLLAELPIDDEGLLLSWNDIPTAQSFRLRWGVVPPGAPATPLAPTNVQGAEQPVPPAPQGRRGRRRNGGFTPAPAPPRTMQATPPPTVGTIPAVFVYTDSLSLPAGSLDTEIDDLALGSTYQFELCKICPDGSLECTVQTVTFNGLDDDCLTSLDIMRTDSTDTSLTLSWTADPADFSADSTFVLIWQLSDGTAPADSAVLQYPTGTYTIDSLEAFRAYDIRICAECTTGQPACIELEPFGGCPAAYSPYLADIEINNALIAWQPLPGDSLLPTNARYKARVALQWDSLNVGQHSYFTPANYNLTTNQTAEVLGLSRGITYLVQIQTQCTDSIWSDWSEPVMFNIDCAIGDSLWLNQLTDSSALVAGLSYSNASYYAFEYRRTDQQDWTVVSNLPNSVLDMQALRAETEYEVRMRYWCTQGVWSDYSPSFFFTTLPPCEPPFRISVDPILADAAQLNWDNYINATQVELRYRPKLSGYYYMSFWPPPWQTAVVPDSLFYLAGLQGGAAYEYQMRSDCAVNLSEWTAVDEFALLCSPPEVIAVTDSTYESAIVQLSGLPPSVQSSTLQYRRLGDSTWISRSTTFGYTSMQNLDDMTYYELRATATCSSGQTSEFSDTIQFRTPVKCLVPENLLASDVQPFSAQIDWDVTGTIDEWEVRVYGPIGPTLPITLAPQSAAPLQMGPGANPRQSTSPGGGTPPANNSSRGGGRQTSPGGNSPAGGSSPIGGAPITTAPVSTAPLGVSINPAPVPQPYANWHSFFVTNPTKLLEELRQNTDYLVVVRARCPEFGWTDYSDTLSFRTLKDCRIPVNLMANEIYQTTTRTNWMAVNSHAEEYMVSLESLHPISIGGPAIQNANPIQGVLPGGGSPQMQGGGQIPGGGQSPAGGQTQGRGGQGQRNSSGGGDAFSPVATAYAIDFTSFVYYRDSILTPELNAMFTGLQPNTEYRFRVKSRCDNYGWTDYSDWVIFRTDECSIPQDIVEEALDRTTMRIAWTPSYGINDYEFKYKLADDPGANWTTINTPDPAVELTPLLTNQIYDYQVTEICQGGTGQRVAPQDSFLMKRPSLNNGFYVCGMEGQVDLSNQIPLAALVPGDTIIAFDFPITITMASGSGGYFSGMGDIQMPYFNKAKFTFEFDNIFVNDEYRMVGGYLEATGFGVEVLPPWADSLLSDILDVLELADSVLQQEEIGLLEDLMALGENANLPPDLQQDIQDVLDCFEQAATQAQIDSCNVLLDSVLIAVNDWLDQLYEGDFQVVFKKDQNQQFGFDGKRTQEPEAWYDKRTLAGADYIVSYKSVKENGPDLVDGVVLPPGIMDSVAFSQPSGIPLPTAIDGDTATITFMGQTGDDYFLVAEQVTNDSTPNHIAGLLKVVPYPELPLQVVLVPLSSSAASGLSATAIEQGLLGILGQAVVKPIVTIASPFTAPGYDGTLDAVGSGLLTNYSVEMRSIINAYEEQPNGVNPNAYYLFITDDYEQTTRSGFMPRGRQFGFLYKGNAGLGNSFAQVLAHELGHGAYVLEHSFDAYATELPQGSTDNLMDYNNGTHLYKWQWDLIHDPVAAPLLPGDDEAALLFGMNFAAQAPPPPPPPPTFYSINSSCKYVKTARGVYVKFSDSVLQAATFAFNSDGSVKAVKHNNNIYQVRYYVKAVEGQEGVVDVTVSPRFVNFALSAGFTSKQKVNLAGDTINVTTPTSNALLSYGNQTYCSPSEPGKVITYTSSGGVCETKSCPWIINFAGAQIDTTGLQELISGGRPVTTHDGLGNAYQRRTLKAYIVVSSDAKSGSYSAAQNHSAPGLQKIWLHQDSTGAWTVKGEDGWSQNAKDFFKYDPSYSAQGLFSAIGNTFQSLSRGVYEFLDLVEKSLNYIKIPEYAWNCDSTDIYKPVYAEVYGYIMAPINANIMLVLDMIDSTQLDQLGFSTKLKENIPRYQFAFLCGVWNGMIDVLGTVPKLLKWVVDPVGEYTKFTDMLDNLKKMERFKPNGDPECTGYWCLLYELKDQFNFYQNPCTAFHNTAGVALGVACAVLTAGAGTPALASTSAGRVVLTIAKVLNRIDDMTDVLGHGFRLASKVTGGIRIKVLKLSDDFPLNKLGEVNGDGTVTLIKNDGTTINVPEADFNGGNLSKGTDGEIYFKQSDGTQVELRAKRRQGINWPSNLSFTGLNSRIKDWFDLLKASGKIRLGDPSVFPISIFYKKVDGTEVEVSKLQQNGTEGNFTKESGYANGEQVKAAKDDGEIGVVEKQNGDYELRACGCVNEGTLIATEEGLKPIEQVKQGDWVYSQQESQTSLAKVSRIIQSGADKVYRVFSGSNKVDLTGGHSLFAYDLGRQVVVDSLQKGWKILALSGLLLTVDSIQILSQPASTFDLRLENGDGYFAGEDNIWLPPNYCNLMLKYQGFSNAQIQKIGDIFDNITPASKLDDFSKELYTNPDLEDFFKNSPDLATLEKRVLGWDAVSFSTIRKDVNWLQKIAQWKDAGITFQEITGDANMTNLVGQTGSIPAIQMIGDNGTKMGLIVNGKLLSTKYNSAFPTNDPIEAVIDNCRVFRDGSRLRVLRTPDTSPYTTTQKNALQAHHDAHCLEKHGPTVTDEALMWRALTGRAPNGQKTGPVNASRFNSAADIQLALTELGPSTTRYANKLASLTAQEIAQGRFAIKFTFPNSMGYGYRRNTLNLEPEIYEVLAAYKLDPATGNYYMVTMFPNIP